MLTQNFKPARSLRISEKKKSALILTLKLLETGKLTHVPNANGLVAYPDNYHKGVFTGHFNMDTWLLATPACGTIACIGATAEMVGGVYFGVTKNNDLNDLFGLNLDRRFLDGITTDQAAIALRSYLVTGKANWENALKA